MTHPTQYLKDYQAPLFTVESIHLTVDINPGHTQVNNCLKLNKQGTHQEPLRLNGEHQTLISVALDGQTLAQDAYTVDANGLTLPTLPAQCELTIVSTHIPENNKRLNGLYYSNGIYCTQCEPHGFRCITYYLDRPDVMTVFTTTITADKTTCPVLLSNGNLIDGGDLDNNRHFATWQDPHKKPSYLFALVAGDLAANTDQFTTQSGRCVTLKIYTQAEDIDKTDYAMFALKSAMAWDEKNYGLEYDLDIFMIVAIHDFNMGAMENKGLNVFNSKYILADPKTATDADYEAIYTVVGHEYFHNWTGNRVTCRDWFQLSLKEGLTVFRDQCFTQDGFSHTVKRIEQVNVMRGQQFAEDASPMAHPIRPDSYQEMNNFYTATVYDKGAEVIRMQHTLTGATGFRRGMDLYFERHDGQAVTCDDFVNAIADANELDFTQFKRWYSQAGTTVVSFTTNYDVEAKIYTLTAKQHCHETADGSAKEPLCIPIRTGLIGPNGEAFSTTLNGQTAAEHILHLNSTAEIFIFHDVERTPVPSLLRDFSAPVKIDFPYTIDQLIHLLHHDHNAFNRWDAGQTLVKLLINQLVEQADLADTYDIPEEYFTALEHVLTSTTLDPALIAATLTLPTVATLAESMEPIRIDALVSAHRWLKQQIAQHLQTDLLAVWHANQDTGEYRFTATAIAQRTLKNLCLSYLVESQTTEALALCQTQFAQANNMTDQFAALRCLAQQPNATALDAALASFHQQWQQEELVIDKWLMVQALANQPDVLDRVKALTQHASYNQSTPNKVYALILGFTRNTEYFHHSDGSGYVFVAEQAIALDKTNPQVAARIVKQLMSWQRYDKKRRHLMKAALEHIAHNTQSSDVQEIVTKSL